MTARVWPPVTVIVPVYNGAAHLDKLLASLKDQTYPWERLRLVVVDDDSKDDTREIAARYGAKIARNGHHHIERGKAIGLAVAESEFLCFLDADNYLVDPGWLARSIALLEEDPELVGAQSVRFHYRREDPPANRYCSLMGVNDPLAYYLKRRDRLTGWEKTWRLPGRVEDHGDHWIGAFTPEDMPTLGSQGFVTRRSLLKKVNHDPYLFHLEANLELIRQGHRKYVLLKSPVGHDHVDTARGFIRKCRRNIQLFYRYAGLRTYRYETPTWKLAWIAITMTTVLRPLFTAVRGYLTRPDPAWFLHVYFSTVVPLIYAWETVKYRTTKK